VSFSKELSVKENDSHKSQIEYCPEHWTLPRKRNLLFEPVWYIYIFEWLLKVFCPLQTPFEAINYLSFSLTLESILCFTSYMCHTHKICTCFGNLCAACHEHWFRSKTIAYIMLEIKVILNITTMVVDLRFHKWKQCPLQILWIS
jgi:hypothetical protein